MADIHEKGTAEHESEPVFPVSGIRGYIPRRGEKGAKSSRLIMVLTICTRIPYSWARKEHEHSSLI